MGYVLGTIFGVIALSCWMYVAWMRISFFRTRFRVISIEEQAERRRKGLCAQCGYDLRATPERCPECGKKIERPAE